VRVKDINPGAGSSIPFGFTILVLNGALSFFAFDGRAQQQGQNRHEAPEYRRDAVVHEEIIRREQQRRSAKNNLHSSCVAPGALPGAWRFARPSRRFIRRTRRLAQRAVLSGARVSHGDSQQPGVCCPSAPTWPPYCSWCRRS
jgi:hypothetical protein